MKNVYIFHRATQVKGVHKVHGAVFGQGKKKIKAPVPVIGIPFVIVIVTSVWSPLLFCLSFVI